MRNQFAFRAAILCSLLLIYTTGCSCSNAPESPPGPGPVGDIKDLNTGEIKPLKFSNQPATNGNRPITNPGNAAATKAATDKLPEGLPVNPAPK